MSRRRTRRSVLPLAGLLLAACGAPGLDADPGTRPAAGVSTTACAETPVAADRCPPFVADWYQQASRWCREVGGTPSPAPGVHVWTLDADHDGQPEYLFDSAASMVCDGAASLFGCGSQACPKTLYRRVNPGWVAAGSVYVTSPADLTAPTPGTLKVSCSDGPPCEVTHYYAWQGEGYEVDHLLVRGHRVQVAGSLHGLHALEGATAVLAAPDPAGAVVDHYAAGTDMAVIGSAGDYYYVSPCNACRSGFVPRASLVHSSVVPR